MSVLDKIEKSRVDVRLADSDSEKVIVELELFSSELYEKSDYRMVWCSFPVGEWIIEHSSYFGELYDFLDYMPDVVEHTSVYVLRYFRTTFVHPNPLYRSEEYRAVVGVVLDVKSRYKALSDLYAIFRRCQKIYEKKFCNALECRMTVYWKRPKDETLYKDHEYTCVVDEELIKEFEQNYFKETAINNLPFELAAHISGCLRRFYDYRRIMKMFSCRKYRNKI